MDKSGIMRKFEDISWLTLTHELDLTTLIGNEYRGIMGKYREMSRLTLTHELAYPLPLGIREIGE